ncbi:uncharacterized protein TNCV_3253511 [Trichonephila clavipes]|nr:uncharacterized protein TNCV_3253511 [Trichonephila clavipes]
MDLMSSRYRKPKGRPTKRRKLLAENSKKRWQKSSKTVDEKNSNSMLLVEIWESIGWSSTYGKKGHADECDKNFDGTSGAMEMHASLIMWRRSISDCQMRFVSMLSDGDSKTFQFLSDNKIYVSDIKIEKEECLNHTAKRLGTSLRNKVKEWKVKKVTLGGRKQGSLKDKNITKLQNYYRKAIKDNVPDTDKMKTAIYASLMHCSSTDKKPMHGKCPEGESSWCFYKRAIAKGETPGSHSSMRTYLSPQVVEKIMPVYQHLASDTILERCVAGKTQNSNESLHSCIWRKCQKRYSSPKKAGNSSNGCHRKAQFGLCEIS